MTTLKVGDNVEVVDVENGTFPACDEGATFFGLTKYRQMGGLEMIWDSNPTGTIVAGPHFFEGPGITCVAISYKDQEIIADVKALALI